MPRFGLQHRQAPTTMKRLRSTFFAVVGSLAIVFGGCGRIAAPPAAITLQAVDEQQFAEALAKHRGQVVLVDYWATWCIPCMELFGHTVELSRQWADRGLTVMSVSLDMSASQPAVLKFLRSKGATFENFMSTYGAGTRSVEAFELGEGTLPMLKLYDRDGRLAQSFGGNGDPVDPTQVAQASGRLVGP
jgi:thiol-disulfide isomerase/thioredoxin